MGKILYLPNTHHELRLIPGLPKALEAHYEVRRVPDSFLYSLLRFNWIPTRLVYLFERLWTWIRTGNISSGV